MNSPKFTVIIPTKDRAKYLLPTLKTCVDQKYTNLEILVSDDGSVDETKSLVEKFSKIDSRVRYVTPGRGVGMLDNFEFALNQVKEGFVIALGGDDGLMPNAIEDMWGILKNSGKSLLTWNTPIFSYPGTRTTNGQLIAPFGNKKYLVNSSEFLSRQSRNLSYTTDKECPMFYVKGVVSVDLINKVKGRTPGNRFYSCPTPDGYSGIVLAGEVDSYIYTDQPLSIHGLSPTSQGLSYLSQERDSKKRSEEFFANVSSRPMHSELASQPYSPLITLMTADYLLSARDLKGWQGSFPEINYKNLIFKSISELSHGLYSSDRIPRELNILKNISLHHSYYKEFNEHIRSKRRYINKMPIQGSAISPEAIFLDAKQIGIGDVYEASQFSYALRKFEPLLSAKSIYKALSNSIAYRLSSRKKGDKFPVEF